MSDDVDDVPAVDPTEGKTEYRVDASRAGAVQVGDRNTQVTYYYGAVSWSDRVASPPLVSVSGDIESPYRGLNAFDERDAAFFFGRDAAVAEVMQRIDGPGGGSRIVVVSGMSGSGKTSLLRAGLVPRLRPPGKPTEDGRGDSWRVLYLTPSRSPLDSLAVALANVAGLEAGSVREGLTTDPLRTRILMQQISRAGSAHAVGSPGERVLLIVDQFEQIFTLCRDERERSTFVRALDATTVTGAGEPSTAVLLIGVRADFEAQCANYPELSHAVQSRFLLTSMTELQLRMAITEPARVAGSRVEDELVQTLLDEFRAHQSQDDGQRAGGTVGAGALPLLSHALDQAWRSRTGSTLTLVDYERTGGIEAAIAATAQSTYESLTARQRALARDIFLRLTAVQTDGLDVSSMAGRAELTEGLEVSERQDVQAVLEAFSSQRLLTLDSDSVEISHEAVLTAWPLLRDSWLAQTHADRLVRTRLRASADEWDKHRRDPAYLYRGNVRTEAEGAVRRMSATNRQAGRLGKLEAEFLHASGRAQRRRDIIRRATLAAIALLIVALTTSTVWATRASVDAQTASAEAARQRDLALSRQLLAQSRSAEIDSETARVMSLASWALVRNKETRLGMIEAAARPLVTAVKAHDDMVWSSALTSRGTVFTGSPDGVLQGWDVQGRREAGVSIKGPEGSFFSVAASPTGEEIAGTIPDGRIGLWRITDGEPIGKPLRGQGEPFSELSFSPDGRQLAATSFGGETTYIWDLAHPDKPRTVAAPELGDSFTWNAAAEQRARDVVERASCTGAIVSSTRKAVACFRTGEAGIAWLVNLSISPPRWTRLGVPSLSGLSEWAVFSPGGRELAFVGAAQRSVSIWDVTTGERIADERRVLGSGVPKSLEFSADGGTLVGGSSDGTVIFWEVRPKARTEAVVGRYQAENVHSFFGPTGHEYINVDTQGQVSIRNVTGGGLLRKYRVDVGALALSPDRRTLATIKQMDPLGDDPSGTKPSGALRYITVYDSMSGKVLRRVETPIEGLHLAFSHDGTRLVLDGDASPATDTQTISVLDVSTLRRVAVYEREPKSSITAQMDSGDTPNVLGMDARDRLIIGTDSGRVDIVENVLTGPTTHSLSPHAWELTALTMHRLSDKFATASGDGSIRLWDSTHDGPIGASLRGGTEGTTALSFSSDGRTLAEGRQTGSIQLWDLDTRSPIGDPLTGHTGAVSSIEFSPDGKTLLSGGNEGTIRLWNTAHVLDPVQSLCKDVDHAFLVEQWRILAPTAPSTGSVCGT